VTAPDYEGVLRFPVYIPQCSLTYSEVVPNKKMLLAQCGSFHPLAAALVIAMK
jgi:hypothetical protein